MRRVLKRLLQIILLLVLLAAGILALNYFNNSLKSKSGAGADLANADATISILNWNIGYAGLGKESDFIMDGGENLLPPSVEIVEKNLAGIQKILRQNKTDFYTIQEISEPDMLNLGVDVLGGVTDTLSGTDWFFSYDFRTQFIPRTFALKHGLALIASVKTDPVKLIRLPNEPTRLQGLIQRQYHIQTREFTDADGNAWVILNIHLSAFDEGGNIRVQQYEKLLEIAGEYYADGKHVVIGGDWNMQLTPTNFSHTTKEKDLFWLKILPYASLPADWELVFDPNVPTVRTNERPYIKGENYTTIIDGFLVSPNVEVVSARGIDTNFEFTDHQPTLAKFKSRP
ncbi:MAG: endonuclease/exonuclease/phosphatase family protein [Robiginitomaculum sp.]|nr:endonuclease/exonuclease/phosphatase family protein [Robiginitomaculum sp.]